MIPRRRQRMILIGLVVCGVAVSVGLALRAFEENLLYFFSPPQVAEGEAPEGRTFRLGGLVLEDSLEREAGSLTISFVVTDYEHSMLVRYTGVLPDLFGFCRAELGCHPVGQVGGIASSFGETDQVVKTLSFKGHLSRFLIQ